MEAGEQRQRSETDPAAAWDSCGEGGGEPQVAPSHGQRAMGIARGGAEVIGLPFSRKLSFQKLT